MGSRILLIDDDDSVRRVLRDLLIKLGHSCETAVDGRDALNRLNSETYDIVLADIKMPGIDGIRMLEEIRSKDIDVDVIMMTGYSMQYSYLDVIEKGSTDFINKPIHHLELKAKIDRIERERGLREELKVLTITDSLTGLFNYRHFHETLRKEVGRAFRQSRKLSCAILDIDSFKEFNDLNGHLEGDKVLSSLARIIISNIRRNVDTAYRIGGDEFAIILVETHRAEAVRITERIRQTFSVELGGKCSVSVGVTQLHSTDDAEDLIRRADDRMYRAKRLGGDQIGLELNPSSSIN